MRDVSGISAEARYCCSAVTGCLPVMTTAGIYLWLPVGDLFGAILSRIPVLMLQQDIKQMQDPTFIPCLLYTSCPFCLVREKEGYIQAVEPVELNPKGKWIEAVSYTHLCA